MNYKSDGNFHTDLIELLAKRMRPAVYVELGIGPDAATILRVAKHCGRAIGVDVKSPLEPAAGFEFWPGTTKDFLDNSAGSLTSAGSLGPIDLAFIDADHSAKAAFDDFRNLLDFMAPDGIILMHDTYPESEAFTDPGLCGDCWKTAEYIRGYSGIEVVTLPCPPGLTIIRKMPKKQRWIADQ